MASAEPALGPALAALLERELASSPDPARAAEGVYGWLLDHPEHDLARVAEGLAVAAKVPRLTGAARAAARLLAEPTPSDLEAGVRAQARRAAVQPSAVVLAREGDLEGLRRLPARSLRLGLAALSGLEAAPLVAAWKALPVYERDHT